MNIDGTDVQRLTHNIDSKHSVAPAWSPDGSQIAFSTQDYGDPSHDYFDLYLMNSNGGNLRRLLDFGTNAAWSPDSQQIVFIDEHSAGMESIAYFYIINAHGFNLRQLTDYYYCCMSASFSPDGRWIAFDSLLVTGDREIYLMDLEGDVIRQLTDNGANNYSVAWRP